MTHAPESCVEFMAPISGAGYWSVCRWLNGWIVHGIYLKYITDMKSAFCPLCCAAC